VPKVYVTAKAWIHLYRYLGWVKENTIYCDTDSAIYIKPRDEPELIVNGEKLGDITSELRPYRNHMGICEWWAKDLRVQVARY